MRKHSNIAIVGIIGAILAVPGMMSNDVFALEDDAMLQKMAQLEQKLQELENPMVVLKTFQWVVGV